MPRCDERKRLVRDYLLEGGPAQHDRGGMSVDETESSVVVRILKHGRGFETKNALRVVQGLTDRIGLGPQIEFVGQIVPKGLEWLRTSANDRRLNQRENVGNDWIPVRLREADRPVLVVQHRLRGSGIVRPMAPVETFLVGLRATKDIECLAKEPGRIP